MASVSVDPSQRFTRGNPCPICHGYDGMRRGRDERCAGYYSDDRTAAFCERASLAGELRPIESATGPVYAHRLIGQCGCGATHDGSPRAALTSINSGKTYTAGVVKSWAIRDCAGVLQAIHERHETTDRKRFVWRLPNGDSGLHGRNMTTLPLYGINELGEYPDDAPVYVTEGEKARDALASIGLCAVATVTGASSAPAPEVWADLAGRDVRFWPDNDADGEKHLAKCIAPAQAAGVTLHRVTWHDAPAKGDAADYVAAGGTAALVETMVKRDATTETASPTSVWRPNIQTARAIMDKEIAPARWAVRELFTEGLNVLAGKPKRGKSTLLLHVETVIAKGGVALGKIHVQQGDALLLALEDNDRRMKERLMRQLGGDTDAPDRLYIEFNWPRLDQGGLQALDEWMDEHPDTRIIGIDTFKRVKPSAKSSATPMYDADYDALQMLQAWAIARHVAVVALLHLRKQPAPEDPLDEISGSTGIVAAADNIVVMRQYNGTTSLVRKGRDYTDDEEWTLEGDAETLLWKISGDAAVTRVSRERQQLYTALKEHPKGATPTQIAQRLGKGANSVRVMLYRAMQSGDEHIYKVDDLYLYKESNACNESNGSNARNGSNAPITEPLRITLESNGDVMAENTANTDVFRVDAQSITSLLPLRGLSNAGVTCEHPENMRHPHWKGSDKTMCGACSQVLDTH